MSAGDVVGTDRGERLISCGRCPVATCGNHTYVLESQYDLLHQTGTSFYCPAGHSASWEAKPKRDAEKRARIEAERAAAEARDAQEAALKAMRKAERTCTWPTCGAVLRSPKQLRQHMVDQHGAPWATPDLANEEIAQVLNGRDQVDVVR